MGLQVHAQPARSDTQIPGTDRFTGVVAYLDGLWRPGCVARQRSFTYSCMLL